MARIRKKIKHQCNKCEKSYTFKRDLEQHIKFVHEKIKDVICDTCGKRFKTKTELRLHITKVHDCKQFACTTCHKVFNAKSNLRFHMKYVHLSSKKREM